VRAWKIYYLHHGNLAGRYAKLLRDDYEYLLDHWRPEGVGWSSVGLPESDDTAMVLLALQRAGFEVDGSSLLAYERQRHFAVMDYERDPSVSANLHILEAVETLPQRERPRVRDKILDYAFRSRQHDTYWSDKWHASVYYPTSRALMTLAPYAPGELEKTVHWMLATQHPEGAWGQYMPTSEETALALLALLKYHRTQRPVPRESLRRAARYLLANERPFDENYPEMWISKALYAPAAVIRATILAALALYCDTFDEEGLT
jgi:halimadienyl-diphosphate synthase